MEYPNTWKFTTAIPACEVSIFGIEKFDWRSLDNEEDVEASEFVIDWEIHTLIKSDGIKMLQIEVKRILGKLNVTLHCHTDDEKDYVDDDAESFDKKQEVIIDTDNGDWIIASSMGFSEVDAECYPKDLQIDFNRKILGLGG